MLALLGFDAVTTSNGGLWGLPKVQRCLMCRGGSFPSSNQEQTNGNEYGDYSSHDVPPPDLPSYGGVDPRYSHQQQQHQQQQQQQGLHPPQYPQVQHGPPGQLPPPPLNDPPPLPPGYGMDENSGISSPPSYPEDPVFQDMEDEPPFVGTSASPDSSGMDLSSFDKEYILKGLARLYRKKILPLELSSRYGHFHSPPLSPSDFVAPPTVLLLGQYR